VHQIKHNLIVYTTISSLVIIVSGTGLLAPNFYQNRFNEITIYEIAGQDIVSLMVGVIFLLCVLMSKKIRIFSVVAAGLLIYTTYTYAYFAFGLISNYLYIVYFIIICLSFYSLLSILLAAKDDFTFPETKYPRKAISVYLIFIVVVVGIIDSKDIILKTIISSSSLSSKGVFYILDLCFLFPGIIIAAVNNFQKKFLGLLFSGAFLIKTIALMPALILSDLLHYLNYGYFIDLSFDIIAMVIMLSGIAFYYLYSSGYKKHLEQT
jgi:hypothetical protein